MAGRLTHRWLLNLTLAITLLGGCSGISLQTSVSAPTAAPTETNSTPQKAEISTSTDYVYYQVTGATVDELRAQMDQLGRTDEFGHHWDAYTEWRVNWSYPYSTTGNNCTTGPVQVQVEITFIFPQWNTPDSASQDLIDKWDAYVAALRLHEDGHRKIAIEAGCEILQAMNALSTYSSCSELEQAANAVGENILEQYRQQETTYDQNTNHGATQGAHFP